MMHLIRKCGKLWSMNTRCRMQTTVRSNSIEHTVLNEAPNDTIGFVGSGNMAQAIMQGLINQKKFKPEQIYASDSDWEYVEFIKENSRFFKVFFFFF